MHNNCVKIGSLYKLQANWKHYFSTDLSNIECNDILLVIDSCKSMSGKHKIKVFNITSNVKLENYLEKIFFEKL